MKYTHKELVALAYKWLLKNGSVGFAFKELVSYDREIPDVIGFSSIQSILIEVKVSRSDFLSDKKKSHRSEGMGNWRFYCCPTGMIKVDELPTGWGLIYADEKKKLKVVYDCRKKIILDDYNNRRIVTASENYFAADVKAERAIMYTALRRLQIRKRIDEIYSLQITNDK
jgi:hypothetical protein